MRGHWTALAIGLAVGAGLGLMMAGKGRGGPVKRTAGTDVTGAPNAPFQRYIFGLGR